MADVVLSPYAQIHTMVANVRARKVTLVMDLPAQVKFVWKYNYCSMTPVNIMI